MKKGLLLLFGLFITAESLVVAKGFKEEAANKKTTKEMIQNFKKNGYDLKDPDVQLVLYYSRYCK